MVYFLGIFVESPKNANVKQRERRQADTFANECTTVYRVGLIVDRSELERGSNQA